MDAKEALRERLEKLLDSHSIHRDRPVAERVSLITDVMAYVPDRQHAELGTGAFGTTFRMRWLTPDEKVGGGTTVEQMRRAPKFAVKEIAKKTVLVDPLRIQRLYAEIAVTSHCKSEFLNRIVAAYHNATFVYLVFELIDGEQGDPRSRLYYLFAKHAPSRIPEVEGIVASWEKELADHGVEPMPEFFDQKIRQWVANLGLKKEKPTGSDLYSLICYEKRIPVQKASIILKQALQGIEYLHRCQVVHRDVKTENVVVAESRTAEPIIVDDKVIGVRIHEKIKAKLIDFGLVKYMRLTQFPLSPSPGTVERATAERGLFPSPEEPVAVMSSTIGTAIYSSLEVINGTLQNAAGRWESTVEQLPKLDVHGCGTLLFCMTNGYPPFRIAEMERRRYMAQAETGVREEESLRGPMEVTARFNEMKIIYEKLYQSRVEQLIKAGPTYVLGVDPEALRLTKLLMNNDPLARPTAEGALRDAFFCNTKGSTVTYEISVDGEVRMLGNQLSPTPSSTGEHTPASAVPLEEAPQASLGGGPTADQARQGGALLDDATYGAIDTATLGDDVANYVMRRLEDKGDAAGK